jgi:pyruvate,water dikinase
MNAPLIPLDSPAARNRAMVGNKAANLAILRQAGLPVPDGFCITTMAAEIGPLWHAITCMYRQMAADGSAVVVRSSGLDEDQAGASFAGQYETVLNLHDERALREAIQTCQEAVHSPRATSYRARRGRSATPLPLLVQRQINPSVSGVLFTMNPVSGDDHQLIVEATPGMGDALLSGRVEPQRLFLTRDGRMVGSATDGLLTAEQCHALAQMAGTIEHVLGRGQDIEWALADDTIHILQSRPIATAAHSMPLANTWTRANIGEVLPNVMTPLTWSVFQATLLARRSGNAAEPATEMVSAGMRQIAGRGFLRLDTLLDTFCYLPTVTPEIMHRVLGAPLLPATTAYTPPHGMAVRLAGATFIVDMLGLLPRLDHMARNQPTPPSRSASDTPLRYVDSLVDWVAGCFQLHLKCTAYAIGAFSVVNEIVARNAPAEAARLPDVLTGYNDLQLAAQGRALQRLAQQARASGPLTSALRENDERPLSVRLEKIPGGLDFVEGLEQLLTEMGARCAGEFELALPRWREDPAPVIAAVNQILDGPPNDPTAEVTARQERQSEAMRTIRDALPANWRWFFMRGLVSYRHYSTWRENMKGRLMEGMARLRAACLEIGNTLVGKGIIDDIQDVFFLTLPEVKSLAQCDGTSGVQALVRERREQYVRWNEQPVPDLVIGDEPSVAPPGADVLRGIACCPGIAEGVARVLLDPGQARELRPGEILVAPHTDPGWTPLFLTCRGVVTEVGGFLSHGATVAREYGIPTVANVKGATTRITSGDIIRIDGATGQVIICQRAARGDIHAA